MAKKDKLDRILARAQKDIKPVTDADIEKQSSQLMAEQEETRKASIRQDDKQREEKLGINDPVETSLKNSIEDHYDFLDKHTQELTAQRDALASAGEKQDTKNQNAAFWGGVTEAVSSLINIGGTIAGAAPMKWDSPQQKWGDKIEQIKETRRKRLDNYEQMMRNLEYQKAEVRRKGAETMAAYQETKAKQDREDKKAEAYAERQLAYSDYLAARKTYTELLAQGVTAKNQAAVEKAKKDMEVAEARVRNIDANTSYVKTKEQKLNSTPNPGSSIYDSL